MSVGVRKSHPATVAELRALGDDVAAEVVAGEVVHKASPSFEHGAAQLAVGDLLGGPFQRGRGGPGGWWIGTEVEVELETHEIYRPDAVAWRKDRVPDRPRGRPVRIRPDWVCEILSPTTAAVDLGAKLRAYHRCGVPHYWVIDTEHETLSVHRWAKDGYLVVFVAARGDVVRAEPFDAIEIEVAAFFGATA